MYPERSKRFRGRSFSRTLLYLLIFGGSLVSIAERVDGGSNPTVGTAEVPVSDQCWIFTHLNKAGGSTVKKILFSHWLHKSTTYDSYQWKKGAILTDSTAASVVKDAGLNVAAGGYTEALRISPAFSPEGEKCKWFTVFRHPIARLVSAYFYCKVDPTDQLCASDFAMSRMIDLRTFAKHWGNFAVRQFAFSLVSHEEVRGYLLSPEGGGMEEEKLSRIPAWYMLKMYLDAQGGGPEYGNIHDAALYHMLQPVQDLLRDRYTAVGILEKFNTTLSLFDATLEMPGMSWRKYNDAIGKENVDLWYRGEKHEVLKTAWTDSDIKKHIWLDLLLYEHAVDVFHRQVLMHGVE